MQLYNIAATSKLSRCTEFEIKKKNKLNKQNKYIMRWKYIIVKCFMDNLFNVLSNPFGYASALATVKQQPEEGHGGSDYFHRTRSHSGHFRKA